MAVIAYFREWKFNEHHFDLLGWSYNDDMNFYEW